MTQGDDRDIFSLRRAGVLLHPTSLPAEWGVLGESARNFVDFLAASRLGVWQTLPLGPTHPDLSPYQSLSAHAGNPDLIDLTELTKSGLLNEDAFAHAGKAVRRLLFDVAAQRFFNNKRSGPDGLDQGAYLDFQNANQYWLDDFCLFSAIREVLAESGWLDWPDALKNRNADALRAFAYREQSRIDRIRFEQFLFHHQWHALRDYAHMRGVKLFGDIPIFVAYDSADVWSNRHLFKLDATGNPTAVAGVPPDYFSTEGQHWGNPVYDWEAMASNHYQWWLDRLESQRHLFDLIRIDHFRGFQAYWEIPAQTPQPRNGHWVDGPGEHFLEVCFRRFPNLPLVAENLGVISDDVERLRHRFRLPGMTVMQFGFDGNTDNPHLLHNHQPRDLVYTGTHDNDTTLGWYRALDPHTRNYVNQYLNTSGTEMPWAFIEAAFSSAASIAMIPMQDFLALGSDARFNTPGTVANNWVWQLDWAHCPISISEKIADAVQRHGRD